MKKRSSPAYLKLASQLREAVLQGELKPGVRLKIDELAHKYETSATPVRQALQALQDEGIVVAHMNKGATVRVIDDTLAGHLYDLRQAVLELLISDCVRNATAEFVAELEDLARQQQSRDEDVALKAQRCFFARIGEVAGNRVAAEVLERQWPMLVAVREYCGFGAVVSTDQRPLVRAIAAGDARRAVEIARADCTRAKEELKLRMRAMAIGDATKSGPSAPHEIAVQA